MHQTAAPHDEPPLVMRGVGPTKLTSETLEKAVVVVVSADPEPRHRVVLDDSDGAVCDRHASRVDGLSVVDFLELETRVLRVVAKQAVGLSSRVPNVSWQCTVRRPEARRRERRHIVSGSSGVVRPAAASARASAANRPRASCEAANWRRQCSSSRSSSSSHNPTRSCSSGGSVASCATAASRVRVMREVYRRTAVQALHQGR